MLDHHQLLMPLASLSDVLSGGGQMILAMLGIAFLIFIHEGGHFLCAKYCGVKVEVFSLGFGKRLWGFERGGTDYRLSLLPLGGYVQMLGQDDTDPSAPRTQRADDFRNKSVGQRALILSGGVAVNALFAVLAFVTAFWIGVPFPSPEIGYATRGGPSEGKLETGDRVLRIDGQEIIAFSDIPQVVAFSGGQPMRFQVARIVDGEQTEVTVDIKARKSDDDRFLSIGVGGLYVVDQVEAGSATEAAGLRSGDRIISYLGPKGERAPFSRPAELSRLATARPGGVIKARVERRRSDSEATEIVDIELACGSRKHWKLGLEFDPTPTLGTVFPETPAARGGLETGDRVKSIGASPAADTTLPQLVQKECRAALARGEKTLRIVVERSADSAAPKPLSLEVPIPEPTGSDRRFTLGFTFGADRIRAIEPDGPCAKANAALSADDPEAALRPGDRLVTIQHRRRFGTWWIGGQRAFRSQVEGLTDDLEGAPCRLRFERDGKRFDIVLEGTEDASSLYGSLEFGLKQRAIIVQRGFVGGLTLGLYSSQVSMRQVLQMLRSLVVRRDVSVKELGGPIRIVQIASKVADRGPGKLIWFLALLSVNLAVLNVLPIPVLDGGHLLFVLIEWLKGGPVSERVLIGAQWVGLFAILALILTVSFNDIISLWTAT